MDDKKFEELINSITGTGHWWGVPSMYDQVCGGLGGARQALAAVGLFGSDEYNTLTLLFKIHNSDEFWRT